MLRRMPRPPRIHLANAFYHVTLRGNHRQAIFRQDGERTLLNRIVGRALDKYRAQMHAYCWMTNHLHMLVRIGDSPLAHLMRQIGSEYARAFQKSLETTGHLFENRYHATLIDTDPYFLEVLRYVHQNPVRAGLVSDAAHYRWSSHATYLGGDVTPWVTTDFALRMFSADRRRAIVLFRAFVDQIPTKDTADELALLEQGVPVLGKPELPGDQPAGSRKTASLDEVIAAACQRFGVTRAELRSALRDSRLVAARAWTARQAAEHGSTLSAVARALNRDQSTLRSAMRRYARGEEEISLLSPPGTTKAKASAP